MAIRVYHQLVIHLSSDVASPQKNSVYKRDESLAGITIDDWSQWSDGGFTVASGAQKQLNLGDITSPAKGLYLEVLAECSVRLSGSADPIVLRIPEEGTMAKLFIEGDLTEVEVDASEGVEVSGSYVMWGL